MKKNQKVLTASVATLAVLAEPPLPPMPTPILLTVPVPLLPQLLKQPPA